MRGAYLLSAVLAGLVGVPATTVPVDLREHYNNKAASKAGENDGEGYAFGTTYPASCLPTGKWTYHGIDVGDLRAGNRSTCRLSCGAVRLA